MINHARTLLLNKTRASASCDWEEYVPPDFVPTRLPAYLAGPWETLFGTNPEPYSLNWRLHQYMTVLHSSEFEAYVLNLDGRIAYPLPTRKLLDDLPVSVTAKNAAATDIVLTGTPVPLEGEGRMHHVFDVTVSGSTFSLEEYGTTRISTPAQVEDGSFTQPIALHGSGLSASFRLPINPASQWTIEAWADHDKPLVQIVGELASVRHEYMANLFSKRDRVPYAFFHKLWNDNRNFSLSLAGFLLTWIYMHHEHRYG